MPRLILNWLLVFVLLATTIFAAPESVAEKQKKAEAGDAGAQFNLGVMYANGEGLVKDQVQAVKWYRKAAEQGMATAQFNLGVMYVAGEGVIKDPIEAHAWWDVASVLGDDDAKKNMSIVEKEMTHQQIAEATKLAKEISAKIKK